MGKKMIIGIIVLLIGLFYIGAPHELHMSSGLGFDLEHNMHQILGVILVIIGIVLAWKLK